MSHLEQWLADFILAISGSVWLHPGLFVVIVIDGLLPFLPVETALIVLLSWSQSTGDPPLLSITAVAALGAVVGDTLAFWVGRRLAAMAPHSGGRLGRLQHRVSEQINERTALVLLTSRFIPVGRVVATMSAGASGLSYRRFLAISSIGSLLWAGWVTMLGVASATWLGSRPVLAAIAAVVFAMLVGVIVDRIGRRLKTRQLVTSNT